VAAGRHHGLLAGMVWLLSLTQTIVIPVITAAILASVLAPLVRWLKRHGVPRGAGAAIVLLMIVAAGALIALLVLSGVSAESGELNSHLQSAATTVEGWLKDLGVSSQTAAQAKSDASGSISSAFHLLINGLG
jgi:predicted PurR-regulated permease PerM